MQMQCVCIKKRLLKRWYDAHCLLFCQWLTPQNTCHPMSGHDDAPRMVMCACCMLCGGVVVVVDESLQTLFVVVLWFETEAGRPTLIMFPRC